MQTRNTLDRDFCGAAKLEGACDTAGRGMAIDSSVTLSARMIGQREEMGTLLVLTYMLLALQHVCSMQLKKSNSRCRQAVELPLSLSTFEIQSVDWTNRGKCCSYWDLLLSVISNNR